MPYRRKAKPEKLIPIPVSYAEASSEAPEPEEIADGTDPTPPPANGHDADPETEIEAKVAALAEGLLQLREGLTELTGEPSPPPQLPASADAPAALRQEPQLPIHIELPSQCRRVREQVLPAWYLARYTTHANDPAVADQIMTMNAALSTADQAMMNQDIGQMIFITRILQQFAV